MLDPLPSGPIRTASRVLGQFQLTPLKVRPTELLVHHYENNANETSTTAVDGMTIAVAITVAFPKTSGHASTPITNAAIKKAATPRRNRDPIPTRGLPRATGCADFSVVVIHRISFYSRFTRLFPASHDDTIARHGPRTNWAL